MDRLEAMSIFLAAVDAGSLSAAGRQLGVPLTTVSRRISDLEAHLGARLLVRSTRRLVLTDAGRSYAVAARQILGQVREVERAAAGEYSVPRGDLVVSAPVVFGRLHVLPVMAEFLAAYPEIDVRLVLTDRAVHLVEEHVDATLRIGDLADSGMVASRLGEVRKVVCASPRYLASRGVPATPDDIAGHACVSFEGLDSPTAWRFGTGRGETIVPIRPRLILNTAEAVLDAAVAGVGLARVLSYHVAEALRTGALDLVLAGHEPPAWPVHMVHAPQGLTPLKLRAFLDFAGPRLRARLAGVPV